MSFRRRLGVLTAVLGSCMLAGGFGPRPVAAAGVSLARDYPEAAVFRQMARRGATDFAARYGRLPASLDEVQNLGYTAYLFPTNWQPALQEGGGELTISWLGRPAYFAGSTIRSYDVRVALPQPGLFTDVTRHAPGAAAGSGKMAPERQWHFPGAQWLAQGASWNDVELALRRERIAVHLNWMTHEYWQANRALPRDLADLEELLGTERNYLAWRGVTEVYSLDDVRWQAGNLFVGMDRNAWVVSLNLGPEVSTIRWQPDRSGQYRPSSALAY